MQEIYSDFRRKAVHPQIDLSAHNSGVEITALLGREIGAIRIEQGEFLVDQVEEVVKNLMVTHFPPPPTDSSEDRLSHPFYFPGFDPANPLVTSVAVAQKLAVKTLLGLEPRRAQDVQCDAFSWIRAYFDRALDDPELDYARCFEEVWGFLRQLYSRGRGRVIVDFYANNPYWRAGGKEWEVLRAFIKEVVEKDLLAAKPVALELMAFAANPSLYSLRAVNDSNGLEAGQEEEGPIYSETLSYCLTSQIARLGVPLAEDLLMARMLRDAQRSEDWTAFDDVCEILAVEGNGAAQAYFAGMLEAELNCRPLSTQDLEALAQDIHWLLYGCPVAKSAFLAHALEFGKVESLQIGLGRGERLDQLKQRASLGDGLAGNSLSRIYAHNQIDSQSLNLSPLERVEAIARLTDYPDSYFACRALTIIYNANQVGESALSFSMEERYRLIEGIAQKGSHTAANIMLEAYLSDQLSLPAEILHQLSPALEEERETLPLNLTHQERLEKLYALAVAKYTPATDAIFDYLYAHRGEFNLEGGRPLIFELLMRRHGTGRARQLLSLNENQIKTINLLSSFYIVLNKEV